MNECAVSMAVDGHAGLRDEGHEGIIRDLFICIQLINYMYNIIYELIKYIYIYIYIGMTLKDFMNVQIAKDARLTEAEVAALRMYTGKFWNKIFRGIY